MKNKPEMPLELISLATTWSEMAKSLVEAMESLEKASPRAASRSLLLEVAEDFRSIRVVALPDGHPQVVLRLATLPETTELTREDGLAVPHGSIDRAISKAAADMLSWTKDPETLELVEHQRFSLLLGWPRQHAVPVDPYAYGLWDE